MKGIIRTIFILFFIGLSGSAISQDSLSRFSVGLSFAPNYSNRILNVDTAVGPGSEFYSEFRTRDIAKLGYEFGATFGIKLTKKLNFVSGISLFERGYKMKDQIWTDNDGIYDLGRCDVNVHLTYLAVPLRLEYVKKYKKFTTVR